MKACKKLEHAKKFYKGILSYCLDLIYLHDASSLMIMMTTPQNIFLVCLVVYLFGIYLGTNGNDICVRYYNFRAKSGAEIMCCMKLYKFILMQNLLHFPPTPSPFSGKLHMMLNHIITTSWQVMQKNYIHLLTFYTK